jgi:hypothetical protein
MGLMSLATNFFGGALPERNLLFTMPCRTDKGWPALVLGTKRFECLHSKRFFVAPAAIRQP